jgi:hypothetical protein
MADGKILHEGYLIDAFIYEGERIGIEDSTGKVAEIPPNKVHMVLTKALLPNGEPCHTLNSKSPMTRFDIVVIE